MIGRIGKKIVIAMLGAVLCALVVPQPVFADDIDPERKGSITINYTNDGVKIPDTSFLLYRLSGINAAGEYEDIDERFRGYNVSFDGLDKEGWRLLANTLTGFIQRDGLGEDAKETTDSEGTAVFTDLKPGLYLLIGERKKIGSDTYVCEPFIARIPITENEAWLYDVTVQPKSEKQPETETVERRVIKRWENSGCDYLQPEEIEVDLLMDGQVADTVVLSAENDWRYSWTELEGGHDWTVVEHEEDIAERYTVTVGREGVTFVITNTARTILHDPPVKKIVMGDAPPSPGIFTFTMEAVSNTAGLPKDQIPMPVGSTNGKKTKDITGAGEYEFGIMTFALPGVYVYSLYEENTGATGYTYDSTRYTITITITDENGELKKDVAIEADGNPVEQAVFTNKYDRKITPTPTPRTTPTPRPSRPPGRLPQTGQLWWPVPVLAAGGALLVIIGVIRRKAR